MYSVVTNSTWNSAWNAIFCSTSSDLLSYLHFLLHLHASSVSSVVCFTEFPRGYRQYFNWQTVILESSEKCKNSLFGFQYTILLIIAVVMQLSLIPYGYSEASTAKCISTKIKGEISRTLQFRVAPLTRIQNKVSNRFRRVPFE